MNIRITNALMLSGIIVGIVGCFLPWGRNNLSPFYHPWIFLYPQLGVEPEIEAAAGFSTLISLIFGAIFQLVSIIKKKLYMIFPVLAAVLIALYASATWTQGAVAAELNGTYTVLYGVYVTLLSITGVAAMAILHLAVTAEKQLSLGKSEQKTSAYL